MTQNPLARRPGKWIGTHYPLDREAITAEARLKTWLDGLGPNTARAYMGDLTHLARFLGHDTAGAGLDALIVSDRIAVLHALENYRDRQKDAGLSSAMINRRLAAVNSALRELGRVGIGPGKVDVASIKSELRTKTEGAAIADIGLAIRAFEQRVDPLSVRDVAILRLAAQVGLRRREIAALRLADLDLEAGAIAVTEKGKRERTHKKIPLRAMTALQKWLKHRAKIALPSETSLFVTTRSRDQGRPISEAGVYDTCHRAAEFVIGEKPKRPRIGASAAELEAHRADLRAWTEKARPYRPHGFRHAAATAGYRATRDVAAVKSFLGHANVQTTVKHYLDDSREQADRITDALADVI